VIAWSSSRSRIARRLQEDDLSRGSAWVRAAGGRAVRRPDGRRAEDVHDRPSSGGKGPGRTARRDYEYRRNGTANVVVARDAHRPWRMTKATERRTAEDFAEWLRELVDVHHATTDRLHVVLDNLSMHTAAALYETFAQAQRTDTAPRATGPGREVALPTTNTQRPKASGFGARPTLGANQERGLQQARPLYAGRLGGRGDMFSGGASRPVSDCGRLGDLSQFLSQFWFWADHSPVTY
jgi:hypothetical protein